MYVGNKCRSDEDDDDKRSGASERRSSAEAMPESRSAIMEGDSTLHHFCSCFFMPYRSFLRSSQVMDVLSFKYYASAFAERRETHPDTNKLRQSSGDTFSEESDERSLSNFSLVWSLSHEQGIACEARGDKRPFYF